MTFKEYKKNTWWPFTISLVFYLSISALVIYFSIISFNENYQSPLVQSFIIFSAIMMISFWYFPIVDIVISIILIFKRKRLFNRFNKITSKKLTNDFFDKKVAVLYTTKDDFIDEAAITGVNVNWKHKTFFILDDSKKREYIEKIDDFASANINTKVIRRNGIGAKNKAGNLNNFFKQYANEYDYFVIMDADCYIKEDFIEQALKYFLNYKDIGIVQSQPIFTKGKNNFQRYLNPCDKENIKYWSSEGVLYDKYGSTYFVGHGAMISKECLLANDNQFPEFISEDLSFMVNVRNKGFYTAYMANVITYEDIPPNYIAFKKRQMRWVDGAFEYTITYFWKILFGNFGWNEKIYILKIANNWIMPILSLFWTLYGFTILFFLKGYDFNLFPWPIFALSIIFFLSSYATAGSKIAISKVNVWQSIFALLMNTLVFTSMLIPMFIESMSLIFGKKRKFVTTIKQNEKISLWKAIRSNLFEIILYALLISYCLISCWYSGFWFMLLNPFWFILAMSIISIIPITMMSNKQYIYI